jgi:hypothetical protein
MTEPDPERRVHPALPLIVGLLLGATGGIIGTTQLRTPAAGAVSTVYVTATVTAQAPAPVAAVTPTAVAAGPAVHKLGTTVAVKGANVTAYAYKVPVATGSPKPAEAGHVWAAIDVKVCVTELSTISNSPWTLVYADAGQVGASSDGYAASRRRSTSGARRSSSPDAASAAGSRTRCRSRRSRR